MIFIKLFSVSSTHTYVYSAFQNISRATQSTGLLRVWSDHVCVCIIRAHLLKILALEALSTLTGALNELRCLVRKNFRFLNPLYSNSFKFFFPFLYSFSNNLSETLKYHYLCRSNIIIMTLKRNLGICQTVIFTLSSGFALSAKHIQTLVYLTTASRKYSIKHRKQDFSESIKTNQPC